MARLPSERFIGRSGQVFDIRNITGIDSPTVQKFLKTVGSETQFTNQYVGRELPSLDILSKKLNDALEDLYTLNCGAFISSDLVGFVNIRPHDIDHPWHRHLARFGLMLLKSAWGEGLADFLMDVGEAHAKRCGFSRLEAEVRANNLRGIRFYKKRQFEFEGTRRHAVFIDGSYVDEFFIAKHFPSLAQNF